MIRLYKQNTPVKVCFCLFIVGFLLTLCLPKGYALVTEGNYSYTSVAAQTNPFGLNVSFLTPRIIYNISKMSLDTSTVCEVYDAVSRSLLANGSFIGDWCVPHDLINNYDAFVVNTSAFYFLATNNHGNARNAYYNTSAYTSLPITQSYTKTWNAVNNFNPAAVPLHSISSWVTDPFAPAFLDPTPADGSYQNTFQTINVSCPLGALVTLWLDGGANPVTKHLDGATPPATYYNTQTLEITYFYKASCDGGVSNSTVRNYTYVATPPTLGIFNDNAYTTLNLTTNNEFDNLAANWTFHFQANDTISGLFAFMLNLTLPNGTQLFAYQNNSLGLLSTWSYNITLNTTTWPSGTWINARACVSDPHTRQHIGDYQTTSQKSKLWFKTQTGNNIKLETDEEATITATKLEDRYNFLVNFTNQTTKSRSFHIKSDLCPLTYLPNSPYKAHFVSFCMNTFDGNWFDMMGADAVYTVFKYDDFHYRIDYINLPPVITFRSIGGLNIVCQDNRMYKPLFKVTSNILNSTDTILSMYSTVKGYHNVTSELTLQSTWWDLYENDSVVQNSFIALPTANTTFNYITVPTPMISGNLYDYLTVYATCPTCYGGTATAQSGKSNNLTVWYSYIDNCSNSFGVPTNGTALNVSFVDISNIAQLVNYTLIITGDYNYSLIQYNKTGTKLCIYPSSINFSEGINIVYSQASSIFQYQNPINYFNNIMQTLKLYLISGTTDVTANVVSEINDPVVGAIIYVYRYDTSTNQYVFYSSYETNFEGIVVMPLVLKTQYYKFYIYYPATKLVQSTNPTYIYTTTINFQIYTTENGIQNYFDSYNIYKDVTFDNATEAFNFVWIDPDSTVTNGCLDTYKDNTLIDHTCQSLANGNIQKSISPHENASYFAKGYLNISGDYQLADEAAYSYLNPGALGKMGLWVDLMLTLVFACLAFWSLPIAVILMPVPTLILSIAGTIGLSQYAAFGLEVSAIVLALIINKRS